MIGLLFFGAIALWGVIAIVLGIKLPKWMGIQRYRLLWTVVLVPLVFFAPVADEIIAYPQMQALCASLKPLELAPGMDENGAYGRTVYPTESRTTETLFPSTIKITRFSAAYADATTKEPVLVQSGFEPQRGMLGVPNGSSGGQMTVLLNKCPRVDLADQLDSQNIPIRLSHLKLAVTRNP